MQLARAVLTIGIAFLFSTPCFAQTSDASASADNHVIAGDYPPAAMRNQDHGDVVIAVLVKADGKVGDAKVSKTSGSGRLDNAAIRMIKARFHYNPAMKDGAAVESWLAQPVSYVMTEEASPDPKCQPPACDAGKSYSYGMNVGAPTPMPAP